MVNIEGWKNIQIRAKHELMELFDDSYQQSGSNSKSEFLNILLENYLNPDEAGSKRAAEIEKEKNELSKQLQTTTEEREKFESENTVLTERLKHYENEFLTKAFTKNKGQTLKFRSTMTGKRIEVTINDLKDTFTAIIHSIQI
ncbi:hypothetical protein ACUNWD_03830 [Sunxiuqinia sp. A32]|uniref:hypothetical protein n=1 Tax=Sunxiuqinia sp. A32 TaxID=3461496 RepID=UPI0040461D85